MASILPLLDTEYTSASANNTAGRAFDRMWQRFKSLFSADDETEKPRQRRKPKPRQDWLVAVGQGHSPARTLRRESRGGARSKPRRKKFDTARLSFGGLEQVR